MSEPIQPGNGPLAWQQQRWQQLLEQGRQQRLPHALLLAGPEGCGKRQFAAAFAGYWLCAQPTEQGACGKCQSCHLLTIGSHPDFCFPQTSGKSETLRVDEIRELVEFCSKTAQLDGHRLVLLQPACSMNRNAQNALLKTLEEPGEGTLLLLVADHPQLLLPTIKSRCQQLFFAPPDHAQALDWLAQEGLDAATAEAALAAAAGAPLKAVQVARSDWFQARGDWVQQLLALADGRGSLAAIAQQLGRYSQDELLDALCHWSHQSLRAGLLRQPLTDPAMQGFVALARRIGARALLLWHERLQVASSRLARSANLNKELQLDELLWQLTPEGVASNLARSS